MSLKSRPDGLDQKLILMRKQKTMGDGKISFCEYLKLMDPSAVLEPPYFANISGHSLCRNSDQLNEKR
jgi:hypothetical protein